jgi:hypothetical protein
MERATARRQRAKYFIPELYQPLNPVVDVAKKGLPFG